MSDAAPLLRVAAVSKTFAGQRALDRVDLTVAAGEIVALVGQNGSGKSTLVKVLAGVHAMDPGGEVAVANELHFIHQDLGLIDQLSTVENLGLDRHVARHALAPCRRGRERAHARELIARFGADFDVELPIARLAPAERAIVAIARALDGWSHPHNVLLLDEPTASLNEEEARRLFGAVRGIAERGGGVVFISHRLDEVVDLADRVVALRDGRVVADLARGSFRAADLVEVIAGAGTAAARERSAPGELALSVRGLRGGTLAGVDLDLRAGEIVGVSGLLGSGRDEVAGLLFGARPGAADEVRLRGEELWPVTPAKAVAAGIGYVPADRRRDGAVMTLSASENLTLPRLGPLRGRLGAVDAGAERRETLGWMGRCEVRPAEPERPLQLFSGGNQQKVVLAKWLRNEPAVLLLDEPTQGVDVGAKAAIYGILADAANAGTAVLLCSSDTKELADVCDRVVVLRGGVAAAELSGARLTEAGLTHEAHAFAAEAGR